MPPRRASNLLVVSALAIAAIAGFEGYRRHAYDDGVGVHTVGYGSTRHPDGRPVRPGDSAPPERALVMLAHDADRIGREIAACLGPVPLYPHEWDAYVSLAYNIGSPAFCRSTLAARLRADPPDYPAACVEILRWNRAGGRVLPGLVKRRQAEHALCLEGRP